MWKSGVTQVSAMYSSNGMNCSWIQTQIQDGHHKNPIGQFFVMGTSEIFFSHPYEFKNLGAVNHSSGCAGPLSSYWTTIAVYYLGYFCRDVFELD